MKLSLIALAITLTSTLAHADSISAQINLKTSQTMQMTSDSEATITQTVVSGMIASHAKVNGMPATGGQPIAATKTAADGSKIQISGDKVVLTDKDGVISMAKLIRNDSSSLVYKVDRVKDIRLAKDGGKAKISHISIGETTCAKVANQQLACDTEIQLDMKLSN